MPLFKVVWEERRSVVIMASSKEKAKEIVRSGEFKGDVSEETTLQPEVVERVQP